MATEDPEMEVVPRQVLSDLRREVAALRGQVEDLSIVVTGILGRLDGEQGEVDLQDSLDQNVSDFMARVHARRGGAR
jgi:hypothetical protein